MFKKIKKIYKQKKHGTLLITNYLDRNFSIHGCKFFHQFGFPPLLKSEWEPISIVYKNKLSGEAYIPTDAGGLIITSKYILKSL